MSAEPKKDKVIRHPCYFCERGSKKAGTAFSEALLETITPKGTKYECSIKNNDCSVVVLYRKHQFHTEHF